MPRATAGSSGQVHGNNKYKSLGHPHSRHRNSAFRYCLFRRIPLCLCLFIHGVAIVDRYQFIIYPLYLKSVDRTPYITCNTYFFHLYKQNAP